MTPVTFWQNTGMLCLLPYHSDLNTTGKHWNIASNMTFRLKYVERLTKDKFSLKTTDQYISQHKYEKETEKNYMQKEHIVDNSPENFILNVGPSDSKPFNVERLVNMSCSEPFKLLNDV
jgi:hypothetical protein